MARVFFHFFLLITPSWLLKWMRTMHSLDEMLERAKCLESLDPLLTMGTRQGTYHSGNDRPEPQVSPAAQLSTDVLR